MFANMTSGLDFHAKALVLRAQRQQVIASNIANADTPGYAGRDFNFKDAMAKALGSPSSGLGTGGTSSQGLAQGGTTNPKHISLSSSFGGGAGQSTLAYTTQSQPSLDGNTVDLDRERANFADNAVRYEATLRFINSDSKIILSAIQGQ